MRNFGVSVLVGVLVLVLSGCFVVQDSTVSGFQFDSNWRRTSDNASVFCTNKTTQLRYSFVAGDGVVSSIEETYVGLASSNTLVQNRPVSQLVREGTRLVFTSDALPFGQNGVPQRAGNGVSSQAITVTPVTPPTSRNGATTLTVKVTNVNGSTFSSSYTYDTYANCP